MRTPTTALTTRQREQLVGEIADVCRRFLGDVGAVLMGEPDGLDDHVDHDCATTLRRDLVAAAGVVLSPDFGEWGQLTIEGPLSTTVPMSAHVDFTDATTATDASGRTLRVTPRELRISLVIDPVTMRVCDAQFSALR